MKSAAWGRVGLLCVTATASYLCRVNVSVAGVQLMEEFSLSQVQMGQVFSSFLLGYALFQIPAGALADRWGARRILALASWWWVGTTFLHVAIGWGPLRPGVSGAFTAFLVLRFLLGMGEAPTFPGAAEGVRRWVPQHQHGRANGIVIAAIGLGSAIAPPLLSGAMIRWGWRSALVVSALPALAVAMVWLRVPGSRQAPLAASPESAPGPAGASRLRSLSFGLLTASYTLQGYVGYIFVFWFYLYLVQERHFDLLRGALMSSLPWILSIVSIPLGGWVSDRLAAGRAGPVWGRRVVPLSAMALAGLLLALGAGTDSPYLAAVYLALSTALVLSVEGPFWASMMEIAGHKTGTGGGIMNMGSNLGGLISPTLTPMLAAALGWRNALYVAAAVSVAAALLWLGIGSKQER